MLQNGILALWGKKCTPFIITVITLIWKHPSIQETRVSNWQFYPIFQFACFWTVGRKPETRVGTHTDTGWTPHRKGPRPSNGTLLLWGVSADRCTTVSPSQNKPDSTEKWKQSLTAKLLSLKSLICIIIYNTWLVAVLKRSKYTKPQWKSRKLIK